MVATSLQQNRTQNFLTVRGLFSVSLEGEFLDITHTVDPVGEIRSVDLLAPPTQDASGKILQGDHRKEESAMYHHW